MDALRRRKGAQALKKMHFLVFGDSKLSPKFKTLLRYADTLKPDFVLMTGDYVEAGAGPGGRQEWNEFAEQAGWFLKKYPSWPVYGNHEGKSVPRGKHKDGVENFRAFFGVDRQYSFDYGSARFLVVAAGYHFDNAQLAWTEKELKSARGKHVFVSHHYPMYGPGKYASITSNKPTKATRLFTKYRVVADFSGHDHGYYHTTRDGVDYIVSSGGGAGVYWVSRPEVILPTDVYYYRKGKYKGSYFIHRPGFEDVTFDAQMLYVVSVRIEGARVTMQMLDTKGREWDRAVLTGPQPSAEKTPRMEDAPALPKETRVQGASADKPSSSVPRSDRTTLQEI
jgi:hypothetical protein